MRTLHLEALNTARVTENLTDNEYNCIKEDLELVMQDENVDAPTAFALILNTVRNSEKSTIL